MDASKFRLMKHGAKLINTARGKLVDETALLETLKTGHLGGAGLDVHYKEPRPLEDPMCGLENVILTPHIAGGSKFGLFDEVETILSNVLAVLEDRAENLMHRVV